jgi:CRISPR-associated protein Cas1
VTVLYVLERGAELARLRRSIVVRRFGAEVSRVPLDELDRVVLRGPARVTSAALAAMLSRRVTILLLAASGAPRGRIEPVESRAAPLRLAQYQRVASAADALEAARAIVCAKLHNQYVALQRRRRDRPEAGGHEVAGAIVGIRRMIERAEAARTIDEVRGAEGQGAECYYRGLRHFLPEGILFERRIRRPPPDPVNALLGLMSTLLFGEVLAAVVAGGLDPYLGFLHAPYAGRPSLACDLMEEWRAPIADAVALALFNRGEIRAADFRAPIPAFGARGLYLTEEGMRTAVRAFETKLEERFRHEPSGVQVTYRRAIYLQVLAMCRWVRGDVPRYEAFHVQR